MTRGVKLEDGAVSYSNGYAYVKQGSRWVAKHRLVAEKKLGRRLTGDEYIRFVDGNKENLDPDNLAIHTKKRKVPADVKRIQRKIKRLESELLFLREQLAELNSDTGTVTE